ncbi:MAG: aminotransferase class IV, partial [Proteobacteria bacterium]|nr:aminotransferase class IV [Pseudomonadota bacterium]
AKGTGRAKESGGLLDFVTDFMPQSGPMIGREVIINVDYGSGTLVVQASPSKLRIVDELMELYEGTDDSEPLIDLNVPSIPTLLYDLQNTPAFDAVWTLQDYLSVLWNHPDPLPIVEEIPFTDTRISDLLAFQESFADFLLFNDEEVITKPLDSTFLHGMTRASVLSLAADLGYRINEREFTVDELLAWSTDYEAALSGTAACLTPVGAFIYGGKEILVRDGAAGPNVEKLRSALQAIQYGDAPDTHGWLTEV